MCKMVKVDKVVKIIVKIGKMVYCGCLLSVLEAHAEYGGK